MIEPMRRSGIFYGWFILAVGSFSLFVATGARSGFGVFSSNRTNQFKTAYRRLSATDKRRVDEALRRFEENPLHPGLNTEKITSQAYL